MDTVRIVVEEKTFDVSTYHASFIADALIFSARGWEETAVSESRDNMRHPDAIRGYDGGFQASGEARDIGKATLDIAITILHLVDHGNSHYLCDPAACDKRRAVLERKHPPEAWNEL